MSENKILNCPHCGNKTPMKLLNQYEHETQIEFYADEYGSFHDFFEIFECPVCENIHLLHTHWNTEDTYPDGTDLYDSGNVLFPESEKINFNSLPIQIRKAYESALKVENIDNTVCIIALRRTLEMVCKDQGATTGQLHQKLNHLQQKGILPPLMGDISKIIKDIGNKAAHGDSVVFEDYLVQSVFRFTNKILEYIYILPKQLRRAKRQIEALTEEEKKEEGENRH